MAIYPYVLGGQVMCGVCGFVCVCVQVKARKVCIESNWGNKVWVSEKKCLKINYEGLRLLGGFQVTRYFCCRKNFFPWQRKMHFKFVA